MKFSKVVFSVHSLLSFVACVGGSLETNDADGSTDHDPFRVDDGGDTSDRLLGRKKKKTTNDSNDAKSFARSYTVVAKPRDIVYITPGRQVHVGRKLSSLDMPDLRGQSFLWFGGMYRSSLVNLVPKDSEFDSSFCSGRRRCRKLAVVSQISGKDLQPDTVPSIDPDWTFAARCSITSAKGQDKRSTGHSCFFDLCLGSPVDCVNVYAGGRFKFEFGLAPVDNLVLRKLQESPVGKANKNTQNVGRLEPLEIGNPSFRVALPPSFPGFVFGGINAYEGIKGTFELITVAQRLPDIFPSNVVDNDFAGGTDTPTEAPTLTEEPTRSSQGNQRVLGEQPDNERELQRANSFFSNTDDFNGSIVGVIVQKVFLVTNKRLPLGPKAV